MRTIPEKDTPLTHSDYLMINNNFTELSGIFGIQVELINCGTYPNDCTGDTIRVGIQKMNRNFLKLSAFILKDSEVGDE